jgi:hypothetical protein
MVESKLSVLLVSTIGFGRTLGSDMPDELSALLFLEGSNLLANGETVLCEVDGPVGIFVLPVNLTTSLLTPSFSIVLCNDNFADTLRLMNNQ